MDHIAEDVLLLLFAELSGGEVLEWPDAIYEHEKAKAPFLISSVCRRWRNIACNVPTLWTYFGFPDNPSQYPQHATRLQVLLEASGSAPVDVIVVIGTASDYHRDSIALHSILCEGSLAAIGGIGARWRNVRFRLPERAAIHLQPALQGNLPQLVSLSAVTDAEWYSLPSAPRLTRLYQECLGAAEPGVVSLEGDTFPSLSNLAILSANPYSNITYALCEQNATRLQHLCIMDSCFKTFDPIHLLRLLSLEVDDQRWLAYLRAPNLRSLAINGSTRIASSDVLAAFAGIVELTLHSNIDPGLVAHLTCLTAIRVLSFCQTAATRTCYPRHFAYRIPRGFFASLNVTGEGPPVWPSLERVYFEQSGREHLNFDVGDLRTFVGARNKAYDAGSRATCRVIVEGLNL